MDCKVDRKHHVRSDAGLLSLAVSHIAGRSILILPLTTARGHTEAHLWIVRYQRSLEELCCVSKVTRQIRAPQGPFPGKSLGSRGLYRPGRGWRSIFLQGGRRVSTVSYSGRVWYPRRMLEIYVKSQLHVRFKGQDNCSSVHRYPTMSHTLRGLANEV